MAWGLPGEDYRLGGAVCELPADRVNRDGTVSRLNALWVSYLIYVETWSEFVCTAFVIDSYEC